MSSASLIIHLLGAVSLLLWGIRMLTGAVEKAFGASLRQWIGVGLADRGRAFLTGIGVTAILQSSTATALMATSFSSGGLMDLVPGLALMLGANVGTTLVVQFVAFDIHHAYPLLVFIGGVIYRRARSQRWRETGRALVGLSLMFLALVLLQQAMEPVAHSETIRQVLRLISSDRLVAILVSAAFAFAALSSVAGILLAMSLQTAGVIGAEPALAMVLGANLGSAVNPLLAARGGDPARLRLPVGNLLTRLVGVVMIAPLLPWMVDMQLSLAWPPQRMAADFHVIFNLAMAALFLGLLPRLAPLLVTLLPARANDGDPARPVHLDQAALATPFVAVSNAARETMRMADLVAEMLRGARTSFQGDDTELIARISRTDDTLDRIYRAVQRYLGRILPDRLGEADSRRLDEIMGLAINLEHIGDIIDKSLMEAAAKRIRNGLALAPEDMAAIDDMHARVLDHLQMAATVFMYGDLDAARRLVAEKERFRDIEKAATARHFDLVRAGSGRQIEGSALRLDITRDLKRIDAHVAATAHAVLERGGALRQSRLEGAREA